MPDSATVLHDHAYQGASVLANDTDTGPGPLTAQLLTGTSHGTVLVNGDGTYSYTPAAGYLGADQFTYQASDGANSDSATVSITVYDNAPTANSFSVTGVQNSSISLAVPANASDPDSDPLTTIIVTGPQNGMAFANSDGTITYTPNPGFTGTDSLTYQANDGALSSNSATVSINVVAPVANDDAYTVPVADPLGSTTLDVCANDSDPTPYPLTPVIVQYPQNGMAYVANGGIVYTPNPGFAGTDSFTYQDAAGPATSNVATVSLIAQVVPAGRVINLNDTGAGTGSLRAAIIAANNGETQSITFQAGLTGYITLGTVLPVIQQNVTITGPAGAAGSITVTRGATDPFSIFSIAQGVECSISQLGITNGSAPMGGMGGGIRNAGVLTLNNVTIWGNSASFGGGIANLGSLTIGYCDIHGNLASTNGGGIGNAGTLNMVSCAIDSNQAEAAGGGIYNGSSATAQLTSCDGATAICSNDAGDGGGIYNLGNLQMAGDTITSNSTVGATGCGGGMYNGGTAICTNLEFDNNTALNGGGVFVAALSQSQFDGTTGIGNTAEQQGDGAYVSNGAINTTRFTNTAGSFGFIFWQLNG